jgi:hypothetical protein
VPPGEKNTEKTKKVTEEFNEFLHTFRISVAQDKSVSARERDLKNEVCTAPCFYSLISFAQCQF